MQVAPSTDFIQRCGHLGGKELVSIETFTQRVLAAAQARERLGSDIIIIARTDALQTDNFDEAVRRLKAAIAAGADVAFLEGIVTFYRVSVRDD